MGGNRAGAICDGLSPDLQNFVIGCHLRSLTWGISPPDMSSPANVPSAFASSGRCSSGHDAERCRSCCSAFSSSLVALNSLETDRDGKQAVCFSVFAADGSSRGEIPHLTQSGPDAGHSYGPAPAAWRFCGCSSSASPSVAGCLPTRPPLADTEPSSGPAQSDAQGPRAARIPGSDRDPGTG